MEIKVHCNYKGGNIKVVSCDNQTIRLEQDLRDTIGWWFYWNFCVENAQGSTLTFEFTNGEVIGLWGPAVSRDYINWEWLGTSGSYTRQSFTYAFGQDESKVFFSFSIPYQVSHLERFLAKHASNPLLTVGTLTVSEQGRNVPLLKVGNQNAEKHLLFTCRHHACESTASYQLEGIMQYLIEQKDSAFLNTHLFHIVPFVDIDGVENGDQGKSRAPHDHNRDYIENPLYKTTRAIMEYSRELNYVAAFDLHSPGNWGGRNDYPFIVKTLPPVKENLERFGDILEEVTEKRANENKIVYSRSQDIEANDDWNRADSPTFTKFVFDKKVPICCTFEFPYFGIGNTVYTQTSCRDFGRDFIKAIEIYLSKA